MERLDSLWNVATQAHEATPATLRSNDIERGTFDILDRAGAKP